MKYEVRRHTKDGKTWLIGETDDKTGGDMVAAWIGTPDTIDIEVISDEDVAQGRCGRFFVPVPILSEPAKNPPPALDEGGDAFPMPGKCGPRQEYTWGDGKTTSVGGPRPGMSLRDYFAGQAMQGAIASGIADVMQRDRIQPHDAAQRIALGAYTTADAMIREKRRTEGGA